jgi:thiamine pyrophosphokinase
LFLRTKGSIIKERNKKEDLAVKKCVIFCAGKMELPPLPIEKDDLVIAADGGLCHTQKWGIAPQVIMGDFDSLGYTPEGAQVFPVEKDDTDSMLALRYGLKAGCDRFILYGALDGPRHDHTLANYQALIFLAQQGATGYLVGKDVIVTAIKNSRMVFPPLEEGIFSAFCMGQTARGVDLEGFFYPLQNGDLDSSFPLGVSNHFIGKKASVTVRDGTLLLFYPRKAGIIPCSPMN